MTAANVPFPAFFLPCPGEPAVPFKTWLRIFENYLLVINATGEDWPVARKRAVLLHCLGTEGQRIFYSLPDTGATYDTAVAALKAHFTPKTNTVAERHVFRKRTQASHESIIQYIAALRDLASTCEFGEHTDEMIRDQLIENVCSPRIRERLLLETDLNLNRAITLATQIEAAADQAKAITDTRVAPVQAVQQIFKRQGRERANAAGANSSAYQGKNKTCYRCGSDAHLANAPNCPAATAVCRQCKKTGHFSKVCRSAKPDTQEVREVELPEVFVLYTDHAASATTKITCPVEISTQHSQPCTVDLVVDTGSSVSILPKSLYLRHFNHAKLTQPKVRLVSYSKTHIPVLGCLSANVSLHGRTAQCTFFIVNDGTPLLGRDLMTLLQVRIENNKVLPSASTAPVMECVATPTPVIGCAKNFVHLVKVDDTITPVRQKLRRLPLSVRNAVTEELNHLQAAGIIERIDASAWVSPIVVTQKKSGKIRMCVDLREPNKAVIVDAFPLPHMDELLSNLKGATFFSTIDLTSAYYQMPLHENSRDLTAFITHDGLFRFCRVPYGLASAPSAFQKMMSIVLDGLSGVENYLDDIIIHGDDMPAHDKALEAVLHRLKSAGLQLNEEKCRYRQPKLPFLGHIVSADGLQPDPGRIQAVADAPAPSDASTLRSFLGLLSWYSKFLPNHATVVEPMRACLRSTDSAFQWTTEAQVSFETVKKMLVNSQALALFDPTLHTIVSTDASDYGLGGVLSQVGPDKIERTVAFASRTLSAAERKYATVEKEALACVWAVERWRTYLWGRRFTLRTDHQALTTLLTTKGVGRAGLRVSRWSARLMSYNYDIIYRPGAENAPADCMSRLPLPAAPSPDGSVEPAHMEDSDPEIVALLSTARNSLSAADLDSACASCPEITNLRTQITCGWPSSSKGLDPDLLPYYKLRLELCVKDHFVFRDSRLVVPIALRPDLITIAHESHQGVVRTKQRLRELYWWPKMDAEVLSAIRSCQLCQLNDKTAKPRPAPLQPVPLPDGPWQKVAMDIVGPFEFAPPACRYAVTLIDYYSKWPEVAFSQTITTETVTTFLSSVFSRHGNPLSIVTDNGVQFTSAAFAAFVEERHIHHHRSSLYYPAANGQVERFNGVLKHTLQLAIQQHKPWKPAVTDFLHVYRATPHATTGTSPFQLLCGRPMRTKLTLLPPTPVSTQTDMDIRHRVKQRQDKMKAYTDAKRGARPPAFQKGDRVRVRNPLHVPKGHRKFSDPLTISEKVREGTYRLSNGNIWNATHLTGFPDTTTASRPTDEDTDSTDRPPEPRPMRDARQPSWLKDYVT